MHSSDNHAAGAAGPRVGMVVRGAAGKRLGTVARLDQDSVTDALHAIAVAHGLLGRKRKLIPADEIARVTADEVLLRFTAREFKALGDDAT